MFVNKRSTSVVQLLTLALAVLVVRLHAFDYESTKNNEHFETGKNNKNLVNNNNKKLPALVATSITNKEFVFGDEEEEDASPLVASSVEQKINFLDSENMVEETTPAPAPAPIPADADVDSAESDEKQHHNVKKSIDSDEAMAEALEEELLEELIDNKNEKLRKQRIDEAYLSDVINQNDMRRFHSKADLQRRLLHANNDRYDFDYERMILDQLKNLEEPGVEEEEEVAYYEEAPRYRQSGLGLSDYLNLENNEDQDLYLSDLDSTYMKEKEFGKSATELLKSRLESNRRKQLEANSQSNMANIEQQQLLRHHQSNDKPVINRYEYNENSMSENDYNKKLQAGKKDDPFFNTKVLTDSDLKWDNQKLIHSPSTVNSQPNNIQKNANVHHDNVNDKIDHIKAQNDYLFIFIVAGCSIAGVIAIVGAGMCYFQMRRHSNAAVNIEYGVKGGYSGSTGSVKSTSSGDRRLAQSAQMYHYQHQKQQMIAMEKANSDTKPDNSDNSDVEEGDYTVYECPGLAPTGEMEVKNPLFKEEFSMSTNNIQANNGSSGAAAAAVNTSAPPAYSTIESEKQKTAAPESDVSTSSSSKLDTSAENNNSNNQGSPLIPLIDDSTLNESTMSTVSSSQNESASTVPAEVSTTVSEENENATVPKQ